MNEEEKNINQNSTKNEPAEEKMAVKFPSWDLLPPDLLLKRGKNETT